jgi:glycosyltransferase involved in cell wall biosynthesis
MMSRRGHEIIHYGHRNSKVECAELVTVIEPETYDTLYGNVYDIRKNQYTTLGDDSELYSLISGNTIYEISKRKQPGDFLLIFGGFWNKMIADAHQDMIIVEPAIGYPASFCNYKVYPSYACLHSFVQDANLQMNYYHIVIPHYFDVDDFDATRPKEDYFLFVGRLNFDKGITLAIDLAAKVGARLKVCGQGDLLSLGYDKIPDHVEFIGYVGVEERKKLMSKAKCLIMPTLYMEPFGCVAIEGMLSGTPILTNDWGGPGENNIHGVTGFKCRTFEQFEWAARNIHLINPKNCREWAEKNFSFDKIGHMYEEYFQSLQGGINWYKPNPSRNNLDHLTKHYPNAVTQKVQLTVYHWDNKVRLGINSDGGYVIADGLAPYDLYISAGVSCEESFTRDFINIYSMNESNSFAFDGTVDKYPWEYTSDISFIRKNISTVNDTHHTNLDNLLSRHKDAFLKMDIEAHEWKWLMYTQYLKNIKQMVIEFHGVWDARWSGNTNSLPPGFTHECFEKLAETHSIIHVHGNTGGGTVNGLPNVIELTYIRRDEHLLEENTQSFPVEGLDFPNGPRDNDFSLKSQPFC